MQRFIHFKIKIMIKNYELRLGNYVKSKNYHYEITEIGNKYCRINDIGSEDYDYDYPLFKLDKLMGIPLNEEWLINLGLAHKCVLCFECCDRLLSFEYKYNNYINNSVVHLNDIPLPHIRYVHQFQNLYFDLIGSELQVNVA